MGVACMQPKPTAEGWTEKIHADAIAASKESGHPILAVHRQQRLVRLWCIRLKQEVFDTKEFKEWAAANVVLLEVDFPQKETSGSCDQGQKSEQLSQQFGIQSSPPF
jgi:protein disulfide-isomerase